MYRLSKKVYKKNIITEYINITLGTTVSFISKKYNLPASKIYNFCKGLSKSKEVEDALVKIGVPPELINKSFINRTES